MRSAAASASGTRWCWSRPPSSRFLALFALPGRPLRRRPHRGRRRPPPAHQPRRLRARLRRVQELKANPPTDAHRLPLRRLRHHGVHRQRGLARRADRPRREAAGAGREPRGPPGEHGDDAGARRQPAARTGHAGHRPRADPRDRRAGARRAAAQRAHAAGAQRAAGADRAEVLRQGRPRRARSPASSTTSARTCASGPPAPRSVGHQDRLRERTTTRGAPRDTCRSASGATCCTCSTRT